MKTPRLSKPEVTAAVEAAIVQFLRANPGRRLSTAEHVTCAKETLARHGWTWDEWTRDVTPVYPVFACGLVLDREDRLDHLCPGCDDGTGQRRIDFPREPTPN